MGKHRKAELITTQELCKYGCGQVAKFKSPAGNLMCESSANKCPSQREKNATGCVNAYENGRDASAIWHAMSNEKKAKCNWNKGLFTADFSYDGKGAHKQFLIGERGHQCECCKLTEWLGKQITLEMEHVDGDSRNNQKENLKLLCPNCHSQTPTWRRAKKKGEFNKQKFSDEVIVETIISSRSLNEVLRKLDLRYGSASTIVKIMGKYKVDFKE